MRELLLEALYLMSVGMLVVFLFLLLLLMAMRLLRALSASVVHAVAHPTQANSAVDAQRAAPNQRPAAVPIAAIIAAVQQFRQDHPQQQD